MHFEDEPLQNLFFADSNLFEKEGRLKIEDIIVGSTKSKPIDCFGRLRANLLLLAEIETNSLTKTNFHQDDNNNNKDDEDEEGDEINGKEMSNFKIHLLILNNFEIKNIDDDQNNHRNNRCYKIAENDDADDDRNDLCFYLVLKQKIRAETQRKFRFECESKKDRDEWIDRIASKSFCFFKNRKKSLSNDSRILRYKPFTNDCQQETLVECSDILNDRDRCVKYISICCDDITISINEPSSLFLVKVFQRNNLLKQWQYVGATEPVRSRSPRFSQCLPLKTIDHCDLFKFELFNVIEQHLKFAYLIAFAYLEIDHLQNDDNQIKRFQTGLCSLDSSGSTNLIGKLKFSLSSAKKFIEPMSSLSVSSSFYEKKSFKLFEQESNEFFNEPINRKFTFFIDDNHSNFTIHENMCDTKLVFDVPIILLDHLLKSESLIVRLLQNDFPTIFDCEQRKNLLYFHNNCLKSCEEYQTKIRNWSVYNSFRSSKFKEPKFLQFVPINLHKQNCRIEYEQNYSSQMTCYSVGAFTCHHLGFDQMDDWKSFTEKVPNNANITWAMFVKFTKVAHQTENISKLLSAIDEQRLIVGNHAYTKSIYEKIHSYVNDLIDIVTKEETESLLSNSSDLVIESNLLEEFLLEPVDLIYLNMKACFVDIEVKISREEYSFETLEPSHRKLRNAINSLCRTLFGCYLSSFARMSAKEIVAYEKLKFRHESLVVQSLTAIIIFILDNLNDDSFINTVIKNRKILAIFKVLLSCVFEEAQMLKDMLYALDYLEEFVSIVFSFKANNCLSEQSTFKINAFRNDFIEIEFIIPSKTLDRPNRIECELLPLVFDVGINQQASLTTNLFGPNLQDVLNKKSFEKLNYYINQSLVFSNDEIIRNSLKDLDEEIKKVKAKNIRILELVGKVTKLINGTTITCCKSAKDRTSVSITLDEVRFAFETLGLNQEIHSHLFQTALDKLRTNGTRMENVFKNVGQRKYAFNYLFLLTFPAEMRPPSGSFCDLET
ncbi:Acyl-coenzyme A thioesterase 13 [Sarcoptes scabiei]|nr:Acyl-coenzyme A thioesterase 13 [Sarcoptes scabiei]